MNTMFTGKKTSGMLITAASLLLLVLLIALKMNIDQQASFLCEAVHSNPDIDMAQCPVHENSASWMITLSIAICISVLVFGLFLLRQGMTQKKVHFKSDTSSLDKDERIVYGLLVSNQGSKFQSDLVKETSFSKVKLTRVLDRLENKGLLERRRRGMTNLIILK